MAQTREAIEQVLVDEVDTNEIWSLFIKRRTLLVVTSVNFIGFLSNGGCSSSWFPLPTKSYTPVLHHICLNASILTFLLAPCDPPPPLTCMSLVLIFISVHARFIVQLQQSGILSLLLFVRLEP